MVQNKGITEKERLALMYKFNEQFIKKIEGLNYLKIISKPVLENLVFELNEVTLMQIFADKIRTKYIEGFNFLLIKNGLESELIKRLEKYEEVFNQRFEPTQLKYNFYMDLYDQRLINATKWNSSEQLYEMLSEEQKRAFQLRDTFKSYTSFNKFNDLRLTILDLYKRTKKESGIEYLYEFITFQIADLFNETFEEMREEFAQNQIKYFEIHSPYEPF